MKKFLSLALALLMMIPLTVGASAGYVTTTNPKTDDDPVTAAEFMDILEYWKWSHSDKDDYEDLLEYIYGYNKDYTNETVDRCEKCNKPATYYVSKGKVYCSCKYCNETYRIYLNDTSCKYCDCDNCDVNETYCDCTCKNCNCVDSGFTISPEEEFNTKFDHKYASCELDDLVIYQYGKKLYIYCENCGRSKTVTASDWCDDWYDYFWDYTVSVYCSRGGTYDMSGSKNANRGDTRTITFEPNYGYVLYNVTVNGENYGCPTTLTLEITGNTVVRAEFVKISSLRDCTLTATAVGGGTITAKKNGTKTDSDKLTAKYSDTVTYTFVPASSNYTIKNVVIDGKSMGSIKTYSFTNGITKDHTVKVTFEWNNPYSDVTNDSYLDAIEYVTEAGIMGYYNRYVNKSAFCGTNEITVKNIVTALAEMADVNDKLDDNDDRVQWAKDNGIIDKNTKLDAACDVQTACEIVNEFLTLLEDKGVDFEDFDSDKSAKKNAIAIGLVSESTYKKNRTLNRYDLASICYLLANLDVE